MADIAAEARPATSEAHVHWAGVTEPRDSSATTYRDAIDHETYWLNTICPLGGAHDWMRHGDPIDNWSAAAATGVAGICALICFWPLLCCLPLVYVGSRDASKALSDRTCCKCRMRCDYRGLLKSPPTRVPPINPETQQPNSTYGYTTTMLPKPPPSVPYVKATQRWSDDEPPRAADAAGKKAL